MTQLAARIHRKIARSLGPTPDDARQVRVPAALPDWRLIHASARYDHTMLTVIRYLRRLVWGGAIGITIYEAMLFEHNLARASGAPQECVAAGMALVDMMATYIIARALDRIFALAAEGLAAD